jgi:hypothetical protein
MNLIYDRTAEDATEAKRIIAKMQAGEPLTADEQSAYFAGLRGCYNTGDMNRVEAAVAELSETLNAAGYINTTIPHTWVQGEIVTAEGWSQYIANVQALVDAYYTLPDAPELPSASNRLTYTGANAIERLLADIYILIDWMRHSYRKSGTFKSGTNAVHLPLQRSVT